MIEDVLPMMADPPKIPRILGIVLTWIVTLEIGGHHLTRIHILVSIYPIDGCKRMGLILVRHVKQWG